KITPAHTVHVDTVVCVVWTTPGSTDTPRKECHMSQATPNTAGPLTIVIVHGAFTDASSWIGPGGHALFGRGGAGVIERLQQQGMTVIAPPNPLRGVRSDSAYLASLLNQIEGSILLVAHSYGGAVISNAAANASNVVGLVYVAALIPEEGERLAEVQSK